MFVDRFKVPWHRMFIASMGSVLFMETGSQDITRGITFHILLERGQNCFIYHLFSTPAVISVVLPYFGSSLCGAAFNEKGSRVAGRSYASFHRGLVDDGGIGGRPAMGRKGPLMDLFLRDHQWNRRNNSKPSFSATSWQGWNGCLFAYDFEYLIVWNGEILWNVRTLQVSEVSLFHKKRWIDTLGFPYLLDPSLLSVVGCPFHESVWLHFGYTWELYHGCRGWAPWRCKDFTL